MSEELKPCPFCGREDLVKLHMEGTVLHPAYKINCEFCGASTSYTDKDCSLDWNKRPIEDALRQENERLNKELEEVKFALQVEEHDNEYNCAERDKLKEENERLKTLTIETIGEINDN